MDNFLNQNEKTKNKPYLDGFGFASIDKKKWNIYKNKLSYNKAIESDLNVRDKITKISQQDVVVGHIRNKKIGKISYENTQPFIYENQVFCHNGIIHSFYDKKKDIKDKIEQKIHSIYKSHIKGETDSEYLFYLFLSFKDEVYEENPEKIMHHQLRDAMNRTIDFLESLNVLIYFNTIYCNDEFSIITRYVIHKKTKKQKSPSLYYNKTNGFIVSSKPLIENSEMIKEGSFLIVKL